MVTIQCEPDGPKQCLRFSICVGPTGRNGQTDTAARAAANGQAGKPEAEVRPSASADHPDDASVSDDEPDQLEELARAVSSCRARRSAPPRKRPTPTAHTRGVLARLAGIVGIGRAGAALETRVEVDVERDRVVRVAVMP